MSPAPTTTAVLDRAWELPPSVSVRPESFGALLYSFDTRRLSFLKDRRLLDVLQGLEAAATARDACTAAGLTEAELPSYARALAQLADTHMIEERA